MRRMLLDLLYAALPEFLGLALGIIIALALVTLSGCGDDLPAPDEPAPSCADLGCVGDALVPPGGGLDPVCPDPDGPLNPEPPSCACDGIACEPRGFDCCQYMPDGAAVQICEARHVTPGTCNLLTCRVGDFSVLYIVCRPEAP